MFNLPRLISNILSRIFSGAEPQESRYKMSDAMQQAAAAAVESRADREPAEVCVTCGDEKIRLVQVFLDDTPSPEYSADTVVCLDAHENDDALNAAADYARRVRAVEPGGVIKPTPSIFALVNLRALSPDGLWTLNKRVIPAGVAIFEYPKGCSSFNKAMAALGKEVKAAREMHNRLRRRAAKPALLDRVFVRASAGYATESSAGTADPARPSAGLTASAAE